MVANIEARKIDLIAFIATLQQEESVIAIEKTVKKLKPYKLKKQKQTSIVSEADIAYFKRPKPFNITPDELAKAQNWKHTDAKEMSAIVKRMDIQEPIELLLAQLKG